MGMKLQRNMMSGRKRIWLRSRRRHRAADLVHGPQAKLYLHHLYHPTKPSVPAFKHLVNLPVR